jgi:outer membrane murein-binding lipoprotein Lpp
VDLDEVADELYTLPPDGFMAARREREQQARAEGDRELAKALASLPKPATAAWVSNVLVREHRDEIESLVELGDLLREAQQNLAGDQLRALNAQRSQLLSALTRQAAAVARKLGHPISTAQEAQVEETLRAAMADPEAGEAVLSGRLTSALSYSGLGNVSGFVARPQLRVVPPPAARPERPARPARAPSPAKEEQRRQREAAREEEARQREEEARRAAEAERRRQLKEARDAVEEATSAAREAIAAARVEQAHVEEFAARQEQLQARLDQLTAEVAHVREQLNGAGTELGKAERRLHAAEKRRTDATTARDAALARLDELSADD